MAVLSVFTAAETGRLSDIAATKNTHGFGGQFGRRQLIAGSCETPTSMGQFGEIQPFAGIGANSLENYDWDVFVAHAWEDKEQLVRPLAFALSDLGVSVWYDEFALRPGDSITATIDRGLGGSRVGLAILSSHFITKPWPQRELAGLTALAMAGQSRIIPVWHNIDHDDVLKFSAPLADVLAIRTAGLSASDLSIQLLRQVRPDLYAAQPRDQILRRASGQAFVELQDELDVAREHLAEFQCPYCGADLVHRIPAPVDAGQKHWDEVDVYECGLELFAGEVRSPCPNRRTRQELYS